VNIARTTLSNSAKMMSKVRTGTTLLLEGAGLAVPIAGLTLECYPRHE
jgi:hypothetical protein